MSETRFPNGIKGGNGTDLELKSDSDIALYAADNIWISQGTKLIFEGTVPDDFEIKLQATSVTADRDVILPDSSGTIATQEWATSQFQYDQSLNTTDSVEFSSVSTENFNITGLGISVIESGSDLTLSAPNRVSVSSSPFRLANLSDLQRNAVVAQPGDMIYNTTTNKFELYQDSAWINLSGSGSYTNNDVDTHLNISTATSGQVLSWNGSDYDWVAQSGGSSLSRTTVSATTASLADAATENINIVAAKSYSLLSIEVDAAAWVRVYSSATARTNDSGRSELVDPDPDAGVHAEIITTGATTVKFTPANIGWNDESPVTNTIYLAVTNKSGSTTTITATLTILPLEL
jgi:hypothetical protein